MQFPESWLREFCDPPLATDALADLLTMAGLEVEERRPVAPAFDGVVVGVITHAEPHPKADRLRVCLVDAGAHSPNGPLQVVCGAPNARVGLRAPLALVGAHLPAAEGAAPPEIRSTQLRGVDSHGMLCSARELGLSEEHAGLLELAPEATAGADVRTVLQLDDTLFTLKLTPNLAHCLSVYGVAREVSALTGAPLKTPEHAPAGRTDSAVLPVRIEASDLCGRFSGCIVRGVDPRAQTPAWMRERLIRCGQRPVSALVDISNYVMFELGRPSHIFDLDCIRDGLVVRWAQPGERLTLLNGNTIELDPDVGVIADGRQVESLAGIMGGAATAVGDDTRNVYVEAAFWWPEAIAGRARRYGFATDAGHRFERGVDPASTAEHVERITGLILDICGGQAGPLTDHQPNLPRRRAVSLRVDRAERVIGMPVSQAQCADVFRRLGLACTETPGVLTVVPPSWRFDLTIEEDLIEEVIRVIGYDRLPNTAPRAPIASTPQPERHRNAHAVRHALAGLGYQETINFSFVPEAWETQLTGSQQPIRVRNPIASHLSVMRSSLLGSLLQVLAHNLARKLPRVQVFEIGRVYSRDAGVAAGDADVAGVAQPMRLAALSYGPVAPLQWGRAERSADFFDLKGDLEALLAPLQAQFVQADHPALHPGRAAAVLIDGRVVGHLGELHPRWCQEWQFPQAPLLFEIDLATLQARPLPQGRPVARHQPVWRDIALVVGESVRHDDLINALRSDDQQLVREATLFDIYRPRAGGPALEPGQCSMAVRLELLDDAATLTEERIDAAVQAAVGRAAAAVGARLRD